MGTWGTHEDKDMGIWGHGGQHEAITTWGYPQENKNMGTWVMWGHEDNMNMGDTRGHRDAHGDTRTWGHTWVPHHPAPPVPAATSCPQCHPYPYCHCPSPAPPPVPDATTACPWCHHLFAMPLPVPAATNACPRCHQCLSPAPPPVPDATACPRCHLLELLFGLAAQVADEPLGGKGVLGGHPPPHHRVQEGLALPCVEPQHLGGGVGGSRVGGGHGHLEEGVGVTDGGGHTGVWGTQESRGTWQGG